MEHHEAHAAEHRVLDPVDDRVAHLVVRDMAPPQQHVRRVEHLLGQPVLRLVEGRGPDIEGPEWGDAACDGIVDAPGVDGPDEVVRALVDVLVPDGDRDPFHGSRR